MRVAQKSTWFALALLTASTVSAQTYPPEIVDLLKAVKAAGDKANVLLVPPPPEYTLTPQDTAELQTAVAKAPLPSTITLVAGRVYRSVVVNRPGLTITTAGWSWPDAVGATMPTLADLPKMAIIKADDRQSYGMWVNQTTDFAIRGVAFFASDPSGQGEMLRLGDSTDPVLAHTPRRIKVSQSLFLGSTVGETPTGGSSYGQKRAIALNAADAVVDQVWCQDIFVAGQDSQCVAIYSTPGHIWIGRSFLSSASEPFIIGGVPPAGPEFLPDDVTLEDTILYHPPKWKGRTPAATVKNLIELKYGTNVKFRRLLLVNHWQQAQPGYAVVFTMASNGPCSYCRMGPVLLEDSVVWNVSAGMNITGWQYSYAPGSGQFVDLTVRNTLFYINSAVWGGNAWPIFLSNEMRTASFDHNTFIHNGGTFLSAELGTKWPYQQPPLTGSIPGGPMLGISYTNNITYNGSYGLRTPIGNNGARALEYFPDLTLGGNVLAGAPASALGTYNAWQKTFGPNVGPSVATLDAAMVNRANLATDPSGACLKDGTPFAGKGADCARLAPVFALRKLLPASSMTAAFDPAAPLTSTAAERGKPNKDKNKPEHNRVFVKEGTAVDVDAPPDAEVCIEMPDGDPVCIGTVAEQKKPKNRQVKAEKSSKPRGGKR